MAIEIKERVESRSLTVGDNPQATTRWVITGTEDEISAVNALLTQTPIIFAGTDLVRKDVSVDPIGDPTDIGYWDGTITYGTESDGSDEAPASGELFFNFDTGSTSVTMMQPISRVDSQRVGGGDARFKNKGGINVTKDGTEGVEVSAPEFRFSENAYLPNEAVTQAYIATLQDLAWTVNIGAFRGFNEGEVLFMGASGSRRGTDQEVDGWEITFNFAVKQNFAGQIAGTDFNVVAGGWEYIWFAYEKRVEDIGGKKYSVMVPTEVYVDQVYEMRNFAGLGIGTGSWL